MDEDASLDAQLRAAETVGARLRVLRQRTGSSLRGLAQAARMDPGYLSRVENSLVSPPAATTWEAYAAALLAPLAGTADEAMARAELDRISVVALMSTAAIAQVLRDYPQLQRLIQFAAWVGLTEDERRAVNRLTSGLADRLKQGQVPRVVRGKRSIQRERHSSARATGPLCLGVVSYDATQPETAATAENRHSPTLPRRSST